jgi:hypothetical protein
VRPLLPVAVVLALAGCSAGQPAEPAPAELAAPSAAPGRPSPSPLATFAGLSNRHVEGPVEYEQVPPVGGEHHARWLACAVYGEPVPAEAAVHSMEHGAVWITHRPDLPAADVATLAGLAALDEEYVLVSPYPDLPAPVVASSWGVQVQVPSADDERLTTFVRTYAGGDQGGEPGAPCRTSGMTLDQARQAVAAGG